MYWSTVFFFTPSKACGTGCPLVNNGIFRRSTSDNQISNPSNRAEVLCFFFPALSREYGRVMVTRLQGYGYSPSLYVFSSLMGSMTTGVYLHEYALEICR